MRFEPLVGVNDVSKKLCRDLRSSLRYGIHDLIHEFSGKVVDCSLRPKEFWAVDKVSFSLNRGDVLGLIGPNGAGKSTLLKILNGLIRPDKGSVTMRGKVGALIALGMGFNPILTGRENVYAAGAVLGFKKRDIDSRYDAIVDFAELEEFMETPVKSYSTGMKVRLGFAVSTQTEPDVLLLDEVLAVGDTSFKVKCYNRIQEMTSNICTVFVSHSMPHIGKLANKVLVMNRGQVVKFTSDVPAGISEYLELNKVHEGPTIINSEKLHLTELSLHTPSGCCLDRLTPADSLTLRFSATIEESVSEFVMSLKVVSQDHTNVYEFNSLADNQRFFNTGKSADFEITTNALRLNPGNYTLRLDVLEAKTKEIIYKQNNLGRFSVVGPFLGFGYLVGEGQWVASEGVSRRHSPIR